MVQFGRALDVHVLEVLVHVQSGLQTGTQQAGFGVGGGISGRDGQSVYSVLQQCGQELPKSRSLTSRRMPEEINQLIDLY